MLTRITPIVAIAATILTQPAMAEIFELGSPTVEAVDPVPAPLPPNTPTVIRREVPLVRRQAPVVAPPVAQEPQKDVPKAVADALAPVEKADAAAEADLKAAQLKAIAKKVEGRKAAIKAMETAIRNAAVKGDDAALEQLMGVKKDLQAQIVDLEAAAKADPMSPTARPAKSLKAVVEAAVAANDLRRAVAPLQGVWKNNGRSGAHITAMVTGTRFSNPSDRTPAVMSIRNGRLYYTATSMAYEVPIDVTESGTLVLGVDTYTRVK